MSMETVNNSIVACWAEQQPKAKEEEPRQKQQYLLPIAIKTFLRNQVLQVRINRCQQHEIALINSLEV